MPRAGQVKPPVQERLSDRIAIGVLTATFPPQLVDRVVAETGRRERRHRLLPARVVVYLVLALALFSGQAYEEVARLLTEGLAWAGRWRGAWQVPTTKAITRARERLGPGPLAALFGEVAGPLAAEGTAGGWYRGRRVLAIDGTTLDVPDTPANQAAFGRPTTQRGERAAFPQVRVVALAECGTHAIIAAALGPLAMGETTLAAGLVGRLGVGVLLLADRGFIGFDLWRAAAATGAELVWRTKANAVLPVDRQLGDGSYLSRIYAARDQRTKRDPIVVRVVEYTLGKDPARHQQPGPYRLVTTILDAAEAPAAELAALYHHSGGSLKPRWMSSRSTSAAPGWCCAPAAQRWSSRKCGGCYWSITRSEHDAPGCPAGRGRPRPAVVCPVAAGGPPPDRQRPGGPFPLSIWPARSPRRSPRSCSGCCPGDGRGHSPGWSSAR